MPNLTPSQIQEALKRGVTQEQINKYVGKDVTTPKTTPIEKIGSLAGLDVIGKKIAGVIAPAFASKEVQPYLKDVIKKEDPTLGQLAGGAGKLALTVGTLGTGSVPATLAGRVVQGGVLGASFQALDNLSKKEELSKGLGMASAVGGAIPVVGTVLTKGLGKFVGNIAKRIEMTLVKPTKVDIEDGFKVANIQKYNLTGNLTQKAQKVEQSLSDLTQQLKSKISRSDAVIDLNDVADRTAKVIMESKGKAFGDLAGVQRTIKNLADEIELYSKNGLVDLTEAQVIKQAAGKKGAWVFGFVEPDAKATELVYSKFYRILKEEIEKKAPEGVKEINKQISELIPISHAIIRRIPVAERNNALSLTDVISGGFAIGNPKAFGLFALNRALKSGAVANLLSQTEKKLNTSPRGAIMQRIIGK